MYTQVGEAGADRRKNCRRRIPRVKASVVMLRFDLCGFTPPMIPQNSGIMIIKPSANGHSTDALWTNRNFATHFSVCSEVASRSPR